MRKSSSGFTLIEIMAVIVTIGILTTISVVSFTKIQSSTRDKQRSNKISQIAEALEKYYGENGEYPSCANMTQTVTVVTTNVLKGLNKDVLTTPGAVSGTNSITCTDPVANTFGYIGGSVQYTLKYFEEGTSSAVAPDSRHRPDVIAAPNGPAVSVVLNAGNALATITPVTCAEGTPQYGIRSRTNNGTWSSYSGWSTTLTSQQVANDGVKYGYQAQARCNSNSIIFSPAATGSETSYTDPVATPAAPVIATPAVTAGNTTTWSWSAVTCPAGTTVRYQYDYLIDTVSQAPTGWKTPGTPTATSISFTTAIGGHTYTIKTQSQCYNSNISSGWSITSNTVNYFSPITITSIAAISGTTQVGQVLTAGTTTPSGATVSYQWQSATTVGGTYTNISGATGNTYTLTSNETTKYIKVKITGTGVYTGIQTSAASSQITEYPWITVGTQIWAKANLNVGTMVTSLAAQTDNSVTEKFCYELDESNCATDGGLYKWNEAMQYVTTEGAQGICPTDSHIPSDNDWKILEMYLGMTQAQADAIDLRGTDQDVKLFAGGSSGLNIPRAGAAYPTGIFYKGYYAALWSSSESSTNAWYRRIGYGFPGVHRVTNPKVDGYSIRCLKN